MTRRALRPLAWVTAAVLVFVAGMLLLTRPPAGPEEGPPPSPNGYDTLLQAAGRLTGGGSTFHGNPTGAERATMVAASQPVLDLVRTGLAQPWRVPAVRDMDGLELYVEAQGRLKAVGALLAAEAEVARERGDWNQVAASATNGVLLARRVHGGRLMIDEMISNALEATALRALKAALADLPADAARRAAGGLAELEASRVAFEQVYEGERAFARSAGGIRGWLAWVMMGRRSLEKVSAATKVKRDALVRDSRLLTLQLAARAFEQERGRPPTHAAELVPEYLPGAPRDPDTDAPLELPASASQRGSTVPGR